MEILQSLPKHYRLDELRAFHLRDASQMSERWSDGSGDTQAHWCLQKALVWQGQPVLLSLRAEPAATGTGSAGLVRARWLGAAPADSQTQRAILEPMVQRMLGLAYPPDKLQRQFGRHAQLGPLLAQQKGLHVPAAPTPFEALTWAITGQQISVAVAVSLRRKLIALAGVPVSAEVMQQVVQPLGQLLGQDDKMAITGALSVTTPMLAYPGAAQVAALDQASLRSQGFSEAKAHTLLAVAQAVVQGQLPLDHWALQSAQGQLDAQALSKALLSIKGIGPWTVNYCLLRGYGWPDGSLHGDVAVRRAIEALLGQDSVSAAQAEQWLAQFAPWRALVAAHLWASLAAGKAY